MTPRVQSNLTGFVKRPVVRATLAVVAIVTAVIYWARLSAIEIVEATYGENCGVKPGNSTVQVQHACNGGVSCTFVVNASQLGDPAQACAKGFSIEYKCLPSQRRLRTEIPGEAGFGKRLSIDCTKP